MNFLRFFFGRNPTIVPPTPKPTHVGKSNGKTAVNTLPEADSLRTATSSS